MTFKILSLDGGGVRGVMAARILQQIEQQIQGSKGQSLQEYFDLVAGTSTGSLIAAGIVSGMNVNQIIDLYKKETQEIFPYQSRWSPKRLPLIRKYGLSAPKFSNQGLINVIKKFTVKNQVPIKIKDVVKPNILIVAYNMYQDDPSFFVNQDSLWYSDIPLWEICVSSASAPTYFPPYELKIQDKSYPYIDGGVAANNPTLAAVGYAIKLGHKLEEISVISIGTGETTNAYKFEQVVDWGLSEWAIPMFSLILNGQAGADNLVAEQILGISNAKGYLRLQFKLTGNNNPIDDATEKNIQRLISISESFLNEEKVNYTENYNPSNQNQMLVKEAIAKFIDNN
ncbi:patatin-like phospholipase family protein [Okeania sp.]|uniref:patatin-like phospholipase family protein n=1 Tax=Okeania sp. TaxID=3100323 RepID=UPI002B4AD1E2|nr:patatin-like phospholipase family protein [Okeania sp.]MEB3343607.1 patatin-like phospholipase family protein [Okeania sp.]